MHCILLVANQMSKRFLNYVILNWLFSHVQIDILYRGKTISADLIEYVSCSNLTLIKSRNAEVAVDKVFFSQSWLVAWTRTKVFMLFGPVNNLCWIQKNRLQIFSGIQARCSKWQLKSILINIFTWFSWKLWFKF